LDTHARPSGVTIEEVKSRYAIPFDDYGIVIFHPVTSEVDTIGLQAKSLFSCLEASGKQFVVIAPNNDPGTDEIFSVIEALPKERFRLIPSMRFNYFSELMKNASAMIGNSSAGVREAPFLGLPSLDVGTRQNSRGSSKSIVSANATDRETLISFLRNAWAHHFSGSTSFGEGNSAQQFVEILQRVNYWSLPAQKNFMENR
jgi:UDP-N-acetylglucosamine 2-epimerase (hydrolysing)